MSELTAPWRALEVCPGCAEVVASWQIRAGVFLQPTLLALPSVLSVLGSLYYILLETFQFPALKPHSHKKGNTLLGSEQS